MMKILLSILLYAAATQPAFAQHQGHHRPQDTPARSDSISRMMHGSMMGMMQGGSTGMMQGGMMGMHGSMMGMMQQHMQMMQDPLRRSAMLVQLLPSMQESLSLSGSQVDRLARQAERHREQKVAHQERMTQTEAQLSELLTEDDALPEQVRSLLQEAAMHRAEAQAQAYQTAAEMKSVLLDEQRKTLDEMAPTQLHHLMMTKLTMMEAMETMHDAMVNGSMSMSSCGMMGMMENGIMGGMENEMMGGMNKK